MIQLLHRNAAKSPRQRHHQHVSTAGFLGIYIALPPSHLGSTVTSMTRYLHRAAAKSTSNAITCMPRQHHCQHDSALTSRNGLIIDINNDICSHQQADTLSAHTDTIHQYTRFQGQCKCPIVLLGISMIHLHFEDSHFEDFKL
jgi:hypothetical protein